MLRYYIHGTKDGIYTDLCNIRSFENLVNFFPNFKIFL